MTLSVVEIRASLPEALPPAGATLSVLGIRASLPAAQAVVTGGGLSVLGIRASLPAGAPTTRSASYRRAGGAWRRERVYVHDGVNWR